MYEYIKIMSKKIYLCILFLVLPYYLKFLILIIIKPVLYTRLVCLIDCDICIVDILVRMWRGSGASTTRTTGTPSHGPPTGTGGHPKERLLTTLRNSYAAVFFLKKVLIVVNIGGNSNVVK